MSAPKAMLCKTADGRYTLAAYWRSGHDQQNGPYNTTASYESILSTVYVDAVPVDVWTVCKCMPDNWHGNRDCPAHGGR